MPSINDVARMAGVAKSTVSSVLSGNKYVSDEIKKKVLKVCEEISYKPNFYASNILKNNSNIIGLFLELNNTVFHEFYSQLLKATIIFASRLGYQILPYFAPDHETVLESLQSGRAPLKGAIILSPVVFDERISCLKSNNIPFVVIGKPDVEIENLLSVDVDNVEITRSVLEYVYGMGHKNILFLNSNRELTITKYRSLAAEEYAENHSDIAIDMEYISDIKNTVCQILNKKILNEQRHICIVAASDLIVYEIYDWCGKVGLKAGEDISVVALGGNTERIAQDNVTRAYQDYEVIAAKCIDMLHMKFIGQIQGDCFEKIESTLIKGCSVADLR